MPEFTLRKLVTVTEDIHHDGGAIAQAPRRRAAVLALVRNPFAGRYVEHLQTGMEDLKPLGLMMTDRLIEAMGGIEGIDGYGKAGLAGEAGELEHTALWHVPGGYAMRELIGGSKAIVPSAKKVGGIGARLDVPVTHINASYVRSHFDSMEVGMNDAPRADEILLALVMTTGARVHSRSGGLEAKDIIGKDGLK